MIHLIRLGNRWCYDFDRREDRQFLTRGMPNQNFIEKPESFHLQPFSLYTACIV